MSILFRRRPRGWLAGVALLFCALSVPAAQPLAIGEVTVQSAGEAGFAEAMRTVLVRLTGRRAAANDPALAPLMRDARRYVQIVRPATATSPPRVTLDAAAIERSLLALEQLQGAPEPRQGRRALAEGGESRLDSRVVEDLELARG